jgi:hypothetical protein
VPLGSRLDRTPSLGDLVDILGSTGLELRSSDRARALAVTRTAVFDPHGSPGPLPGGLLLAIGLRPSDPAALGVLRAAAARGVGGVVVKAYGDDVAPLVAAADDSGIGLLVVQDQVEWLQLDALLNNALTTSTQVGASLSGVAVGDLFTLAGAIGDAVGGATAIEDVTQQVLAYSSDPRHATDEERRAGILGRHVPDMPENAEQYRRLYRSSGVVRYPPAVDGLGRMAVAIRAGAELLGSIWVVEPVDGLQEGAAEALLGAAPIAALHLLRARSAQDLVRQQRGDATRRLLEGADDAVQAAELLGLDSAGPFAVLAFAPARLDDALVASSERLLPMIALHCETRLGRTGSVLVDGVVFVVAVGPRGGAAALETLAGTIVGAARTSLRISVLGALVASLAGLEELPRARTEARRILDLLRRRDDLGPVASFERVSDQLSAAALREAVRADDRFVPVRARRVLEHDARHGSSYAELLAAHCAALFDVRRTATILAVHPNTVRYRLRRAAELFDLDLADPEQLLPLWWALRALTQPR